ncbi:GntR family transcriptional regulator [Frigoribacterium sp. 2-23]|uniref:GntR family transcriptional regulator n=1 Tax=Frigoribacterium sp. 2-23 TaxID=3415006 RepID=UPI003C6F6A93
MPVPTTGQRVIARRLHKDEVLSRLRDAILDGLLQPGERIRDRDLEVWFGVSRTPIRLAIAALEDMRLVETSPSRYTKVCGLRPEIVPDLVDGMTVLWGAALDRVRTLGRLGDVEASLVSSGTVFESWARGEAAAIEVVRTFAGATAAAATLSVNPVLERFADRAVVLVLFHATRSGAQVDAEALADSLRRASRHVLSPEQGSTAA